MNTLPFLFIGGVGYAASTSTQLLIFLAIFFLITGATCLTASFLLPTTVYPRFPYFVSFVAIYIPLAHCTTFHYGFANGIATTLPWQISIWTTPIVLCYSFYKSVMSSLVSLNPPKVILCQS